MTAKKIFMIEDDKFVGDMYRRLFIGNGYDVELVQNGTDALASLGKANILPDLITLDLNLPDMDRYEILKQLKANDKMKKIPVVVLTNSFYEESEKEFLSLGAALFLVKIHNNNKEILEKIHTLLEK